tara:strand:- start:550 stop:663 length:114 start_codon:yes stop_codon:yes gene_type:complete
LFKLQQLLAVGVVVLDQALVVAVVVVLFVKKLMLQVQ